MPDTTTKTDAERYADLEKRCDRLEAIVAELETIAPELRAILEARVAGR